MIKIFFNDLVSPTQGSPYATFYVGACFLSKHQKGKRENEREYDSSRFYN